MNLIYHALSGYKNWQPHIHLATVETKLSFGGPSWPYVVSSELTFYADTFFKKGTIRRVEVLREKYNWSNHHDENMRLLREKRHKEMLQFLKDVQSLPECSPTDSLLAEAKECLLLDNPPRTGLLLVKLIEGWEKK